MSDRPITKNEFDSQLILVHETIKNSNERNDLKHDALLSRLDTVADQNGKVLDIVTKELPKLHKSQTENTIYWGLIKWIGGPSVLALWFFLVSTVWIQATAPQTQAPTTINQPSTLGK